MTLARRPSWQKSAKRLRPLAKITMRSCLAMRSALRAPLIARERLMVIFARGRDILPTFCHERRLASVKKHGTPAEGNKKAEGNTKLRVRKTSSTPPDNAGAYWDSGPPPEQTLVASTRHRQSNKVAPFFDFLYFCPAWGLEKNPKNRKKAPR